MADCPEPALAGLSWLEAVEVLLAWGRACNADKAALREWAKQERGSE